MNTLGTKNTNKGSSNLGEHNAPLMLRNREKEVSLGKAILISTIAHPAVVAFLWLIFKLFLLILTFLGITLPIFDKPRQKMKDIEFVLVNRPEQTPINKKTKFRADRNTRAGGKHDPRKTISPPEPRSARSAPQKSSNASKPSPRRVSKPRTASKSYSKRRTSKNNNQTPVPPRPKPMNSAPRPRPSHKTPFSMPIPKAKSIGPIAPHKSGPVTSAPVEGSSSGKAPSPMMSSGSYGSKGRRSSGYSFNSGGNAGNPGPGNPNGAPGIDALKEPDFGPYMSELQRRIKRNWNPPRGNESKRVILIFKISRDGRLISLRVKQSSGNPEADSAAKAAVELAAPFRPLPPEYRGNSVDIDFTFDYNVLGITGRRKY